MKSHKYILKKPHIEKMITEEYNSHMEKMSKIENQRIDIQKKYNDVYGLLQLRNNYKRVNSRFIQKEKEILRERENRSLSERCQSEKGFITKPKSSTPKSILMRYYQKPAIKKEQVRIFEENQSLASRIISQLPFIQKERQDNEYKRHVYELSNIRKFHTYVTPTQDKKHNFSNTSIKESTSQNASQMESKLIQKNKLNYSSITPKMLKNKGIIFTLEFLSVQFKKMIIQQQQNEENYFFYEVLIQEQEILRTLPLGYDQFCKVSLEIFILVMNLHQYYNNRMSKLITIQQSNFGKLIKVTQKSIQDIYILVFRNQRMCQIMPRINTKTVVQQNEINTFQDDFYKISQDFIIQKTFVNGEKQITIKWTTEQFIQKSIENKSILNGLVKLKMLAKFHTPVYNRRENTVNIKSAKQSFKIKELNEEDDDNNEEYEF